MINVYLDHVRRKEERWAAILIKAGQVEPFEEIFADTELEARALGLARVRLLRSTWPKLWKIRN